MGHMGGRTAARSPLSDELPTYRRDDRRHWIDDGWDCQDTWNQVPLADSLTDVAYRTDLRCPTALCRRFAPYSGTARCLKQMLLSLGHTRFAAGVSRGS